MVKGCQRTGHRAGIVLLLGTACFSPSQTIAQYTAPDQTNIISAVVSNWAGNYVIGSNTWGNHLQILHGGVLSNGTGYFGYESDSTNNSALVVGTGSSWVNNGLFIGYSGAVNRVTIEAGALVTNSWVYVGYWETSTGNVVTVTGPDARWENSSSVNGGYRGAQASILVTNQGTLRGQSLYVGYRASASNSLVEVTGNNSLVSVSDRLDVGEYGANCQLRISDGGQVRSGRAYVGRYSSANDNSVLISGINSQWELPGQSLQVGYDGSRNTVIVTNQGVLGVGYATIIGSGSSATSNLVLVTGSGSMWTNSSYVYLGSSGSGNRVILQDQGIAYSASSLTIGENAYSHDNELLVTGYGSVWSNRFALEIGRNGSGNRLVVTNQGKAAGNLVDLGNQGGGSNNSVLVTGPGSILYGEYGIRVGTYGAANQLTVANSGRATGSDGYIGYFESASNCTVLVTGPNSLWANASQLVNSGTLAVGYGAPGNQLTISDGGIVTDSVGYIGRDGSSSANRVVVTGSGSAWTNSGVLYVGYSGDENALTISDGALVGNTEAYVGWSAGSAGNRVLVTGIDSVWTNSSHLYVGYTGTGNSLTVSNRAQVINNNGVVGYATVSTGNSAIVTGEGSVWSNRNDLYVGNSGGGNSLAILDGGKVWCKSARLADTAGGGNNQFRVDGSNSVWITSQDFYLGRNAPNNELVITNGGKVSSVTAYVGYLDPASNNTVWVAGTGSFWEVTGSLCFGNSSASNRLTVADGGRVRSRVGYAGYLGSSNAVLVTGPGSTWENQDALHVGYTRIACELHLADEGRVLAPLATLGSGSSASGSWLRISGGHLLVTKDTGTGLLDVRRGTLALNSGTVTVDQLFLTNGASGVIDFSGGVLNTKTTLVDNTLPLVVGDGSTPATLALHGGGHVFTDGLQISASGSLSGTGSVAGTVVNAGTIAPGFSAGRLSIDGNLTQQFSSVLHLEIGGPNQGIDYDFLEITGAGVMNGLLEIELINGFTPLWDSVFTAVTATVSLEGTFTNRAGGRVLTPDRTGSFLVNFLPGSGHLVFTGFMAVPEPQVLLLYGAGLLALWGGRRRG